MNTKNTLAAIFTKFGKLPIISILRFTVICAALLILTTIKADAATFTVTNTNDSGAGSLRQAILNANSAASDNVIGFDATVFNTPQTITLNGTELSIANNGTLTINGTGADRLTISGNNASRVFYIQPNANATISGITVTGGNGVGAIFASGGGILNNSGTLTLNNSTVSGNSSTSLGGGIFNFFGISTLNNSTVSGNSATNSAGGGIANNPGSTLTLNNSTVSGNSANFGGGINNNASTTTLNNSTVSGNSATTSGGGISNVNNFDVGIATFNNSIIANSTSGGDCSNSGTINAEYSLFEDGLGCVNGTNNNNLTGDPNLGPLQNNGGTTKTHALLAGSIAIDAGNSTLTTDQRGFTRPVDDPNSANGAGNLADIGAFEVQTTSLTFTVNQTHDAGDGICDATCTLRDAILNANSAASNDVIGFDSGVFSTAQTIVLTGGELIIQNNGSLQINGTGTNLLTIDGIMPAEFFDLF